MNRRSGGTSPPRIAATTEPVPPAAPSRSATLTDSELLAAVAARSTAAMAELHERYGAAMHRLAVAIVGNHRAERVVHAALLAVWRQPTKPGTDTPVRQVPVPCHLLDAVMAQSADVQDRHIRVRRERLGQLESVERATVLLVVAGASRSQTAAALGEPIETVNRMLRAGLGRLGSPGSSGEFV